LTQAPSTWGLERISQKLKAVSPYQYLYDSTAGSGTCLYVIDSGIYTGHNEFSGRATFVQNYVYAESGDDLSGHGTAVAGAAAGTTYGVAKAAKIYSIKVCNQAGSCDVSSVVSAISLATNDAKTRQCPNGVIINLSLGGPSAGWQSVKDAVIAATQAGAFIVAAAGNDHANVNNYLPASAAGACSVGATDQNDAIWASSNYGTTMAVFAPGVGIQTAALGNPSASATVDGTSMSAPFVAGLGAYLWAKNGKGSSSAPGVALCATIKSTANANVVTGSLGGSPNKLAYNGM
jgi:subtilisin family serine protease